MRNFKESDFNGCGHYIVRNYKPENTYVDTGFLSTIMYKIGWLNGIHGGGQRTLKVAMSDGWAVDGYFITKTDSGEKIEDTSKWKWVCFETTDESSGIKKMVDYLNNPELSQEFRFATQEEVVRVVLYQKSRWR